MLTIQIDTIKEDEIVLTGDLDASELSGLDDLLTSGQLAVKGPVSYRFRLFRVGGMIEVLGHVSSRISLACGRCLESFDLPVDADFDLTYADHLPEVEDESDEEVELTADEMGIVLLEGEEIDLTDQLVEQLLLSLPFQPICKESCKGLCPHCGTDLNKTQCSCSEPQFDTRFAGLKKLKIDSDN